LSAAISSNCSLLLCHKLAVERALQLVFVMAKQLV
jgi:hypothetical protein